MDCVVAPAKVNLALHVGAPRADGYHPVDTVCAFVDIGEWVAIEGAAASFSLRVIGPMAGDIPPTADNLILRGAAAIAALSGAAPVAFVLNKVAPVASGIGAGTADGVAAMLALNARAPRPLSAMDLVHHARILGADGPICMAHMVGRARLLRARGIGERVSAVPGASPFHLCLANPGDHVPTGRVFSAYDRDGATGAASLPVPPIGTPSTLIRVADFVSQSRNDLAPPARRLAPRIAECEKWMRARPGCLAARMSGSGATVFGLFSSAAAAARTAATFHARGMWSVHGPARQGGSLA